jgi:hypothetical protein
MRKIRGIFILKRDIAILAYNAGIILRSRNFSSGGASNL